MTFEEKQEELLNASDRELVSRILNFPDQSRLNFNRDGSPRKYQSGVMAWNIRTQWIHTPNYKISDKQRYAMATSFATHTTTEAKVQGVITEKPDHRQLIKTKIEENGVKSTYAMNFHLKPETKFYEQNILAVYADNTEGGVTKIGFLPESYIKTHDIKSPLDIEGTMTDFSNGKFKNVSYTIGMDMETITDTMHENLNSQRYVYKMVFTLNTPNKQKTIDKLNQEDWTRKTNTKINKYKKMDRKEKEYVDDVYFELNGGPYGTIVVETDTALSVSARRKCARYFCNAVPYSTEGVRVEENNKLYLYSEPKIQEQSEDFTKAVESISTTSHQPML